MEKCTGEIEIYSTGDFKIKKMSKTCKKVLSKINPIRGIFWKNHIIEGRQEEEQETPGEE